MPKNSTILMIRHAEKPTAGDELALPGQERAQAYVIYFQNYILQPGSKASRTPVKFDYLFAAADSKDSDRPDLTIGPLAEALKLKINTKHRDAEYQALADKILQKPKYNNSNLLICWHHQQILQFAAALGVDPGKLPKSANWPTKWPGSEYGWLLQLCYDAKGSIIPGETICVNQKLMYDDQNAPPGKSATRK